MEAILRNADRQDLINAALEAATFVSPGREPWENGHLERVPERRHLFPGTPETPNI